MTRICSKKWPEIPERSTSQAAANSFSHHLWFLSEELVGLFFFDDSFDIATKRKMTEALQREGCIRPKKWVSVDLPRIWPLKEHSWFCDQHHSMILLLHWLAFKITWCEPSTWSDSDNYTVSGQDRILEKNNDFTERGVSWMQNYLPILNKDEDQKQNLFHITESHRKGFPDAKKSTVVQNVWSVDFNNGWYPSPLLSVVK